ncbi:pentapeptide repeat-containing protein [Actinomadura geliboluensis]|uniref:pentapeptide repeat-containing protein n=1 Tax=Actinomadura geliboluensis TaxID=882440 RepID=UPI00371DD874
MPARTRGARRVQRVSPLRDPKPPRLPENLSPASLADRELTHDGKYLSLAFGPGRVTGADTENVEVERCRFTGGTLAGSLVRAEITDAELTGCDLANLKLRDSHVSTTAVLDCRMTGMRLDDGALREVLFTGCRADLASFRFAQLREVVFRDCNLSEANFQNVELTRVQFERCTLTAAQFSGARLAQVRFSGCDLSGIGGIGSLKGAIMSRADAAAVLDQLAAALGITID